MSLRSTKANMFPRLRPESGDLLHLDALRLIASSGLVVAHLSGFLLRSAVPPEYTSAFRGLTLFVDMFFAISGYVIAWVYFDRIVDLGSYGSFIRKRVARLVPLHWAMLAIYVAMGIFVETRHISLHEDRGMFAWQCLPVNFLLLNSTGLCPGLAFNGASWSISAEMCMYLAAPFIFWIMRRRLWVLAMAVPVMVIVLTLNDHGEDSWLFWNATGGCVRALPSFTFGAFLYGSRNIVARLPFAATAFWFALLGFFLGCLVGFKPIWLLVILYCLVVFGVATDAQKRSKGIVGTLAAGGQLTYSSYMLHQLIINVLLNAIADRALHLHGVGITLMAVFTFVAVWPVSYLSLVFLEKPARRWLGGPKRRPSSHDDGGEPATAVANLAAPASRV